MMKRKSITGRIWVPAMLFLVAGIMTACGGGTGQEPDNATQEQAEPLNWQVPAFEAVDQDGNPVTLDDLKGRVWLADFIFTRCPDVCPPMTANMTKVQQELEKQGVEVEIISFSVDPEHDQPEVLKEFAGNYDLSFDNWRFLTGYAQEEIETFAREGFKGDVQRMQEEDPLLINHPVSFFLVNADGNVHERYDGMDPDVEQMVKDIRDLEGEQK
ncbi:SCO family protein [Desmospora profundinema]|uniref:Protein SCO1/2 n=1 Tax=Desmospora profundinema TaxID=1571184 RepID=A0ABU1IPI4_9BACL|nr:SCO family protein [Desmospora profundinema]MDR6226432.1 protein SCO1/2 [Desmospora profundinema]